MKRIFIIDDDDSLLRFLRDALEPMGYEVTEAKDGTAATRLLKQAPVPDVVLLDIVMPEKDGLETLRELRQNYPTLKIVVMSGNSAVYAMDLLSIARDFGACQTLAKPFSIEDLARCLGAI
jgi:CheY-like chemotaxis protein